MAACHGDFLLAGNELICACYAADTFEASIKVGPASRSPPSPTSQHLAASEAGSPQSMQSASNGTVYASADAARVGGGLYSHLLDAAITLATDPASVVASTGAQLLRVAGVELVEPNLPPGESFRVCACEPLTLCDGFLWLRLAYIHLVVH